MPVKFENYTHSFLRNGKPIFAPSELGRSIGEDVKNWVEIKVGFDPFYHHLREGGHVAALHNHRPNAFFARVDIERFFYSIGRNRVVRALREADVPRPAHFGKWSTVRNPYDDPRYALPYGFVQSPILSSLVLMQSDLGAVLREKSKELTVSVYMDDISISANDAELLSRSFDDIVSAVHRSGFRLNEAKLRRPSPAMDVFNCTLSTGTTVVTEERVAEFYEVPRTAASEAGFERYVARVSRGNAEAS
ncbi:reverse transcriptase domain-containing protein [Bosea sp. CS1GBMeth4]|uniref:reverse transcriptase domain-containing protein n=1 Tax=Bosea sp. CS1GBMeth4 TaxID=1892849 RepID=UPI0016475E46|nr:reverse transcriptase domain-containing protein [Bosea sp. CS1GBMeth4]